MIVAAVLLCGCGERKDTQTYKDKSQTFQVSGTLSKNNILVIKINDVAVIEDKITLSTNDTYYFTKGTYQQKEVSVFCTISSFSTTTTFCTVSLDSKELATLKFE